MLRTKIIGVLALALAVALAAAAQSAASPSRATATVLSPYMRGLAFTPGVWVGTGSIRGSDSADKLNLHHEGQIEFTFQVGRSGQVLGKYSFQMTSYASGMLGGTIGSGGYAKVTDYAYPHAVSVSGSWSQEGVLKASKGGTTVSVPLSRKGSLGQVFRPTTAGCTQVAGVLPTAVGNSLRVKWTARLQKGSRPPIPGKAWFDKKRERITGWVATNVTGGSHTVALRDFLTHVREYETWLAAARQCKQVPPGHANGLSELNSIFARILRDSAKLSDRYGAYDVVDMAFAMVGLGVVPGEAGANASLATLLNNAIGRVPAEFPGVPQQKAALNAIADAASQAGLTEIANRARSLGH